MYIVTLLNPFDGKTVTIDTKKVFFNHVAGAIICHTCPFIDIPLRLEIEICPDGSITHRGWTWSDATNHYLHLVDKSDEHTAATQAQIDTVNGLFSGRIMVDGVKLSPSGSLQDICPVNLAAEEARVGHRLPVV